MEFEAGVRGRAQEIAGLFEATFTASEGASEGALIGALVRDLIAGTPAADLFVFTAQEGGRIVGAILFTRLVYDRDPRAVFLMAPVAVATAWQGKGVGQGLLRHGLEAMRAAGAEVAITYGDPNYYGRVGFTQVTPEAVPAPFALSQPEGWQAQSLGEGALTPLQGRVTCVPGFSDPALW